MRRLSLVQEFALRSLVFVVLMALVLGISISVAVRQLFLSEVARTARVTASAIVLEHLSVGEITQALPANLAYSLDTMATDDLNDAGITSIRLWNRKGDLIYASDGKQIGESFLRSEPVRRALEGQQVVDLRRHNGDEVDYGPAGSRATIEVFAPLKASNVPMPLGAFEITQPYEPVASASARLITVVWVIILAGSIPAYFLQLTVVQRTANELDAAQGDLETVNSRLRASLDDLELHSLGTLQALVAAVDAKDSYTARHSIAVTDYALAIGRQLGLSPGQLANLERAGLLHDVGKIGTPEGILLKPERLTDEEFATITSHAAIGGHIVETVPFLAGIMPVIRGHHERWDGTGYPDGLIGERIPLLARVLAVADAFDAMTSERPYRKPVSLEVARAELVRCTGTQFDPMAVRALLAAIDAGETRVFVHASAHARKRAVAMSA